jgi:hypothetical protein
LPKQIEPGRYFLRSKEEVPASAVTGSPHKAGKVKPQPGQQAILSLANLLPQAVAQLGTIHTRHTIRDLFPFSDAHAVPPVMLRKIRLFGVLSVLGIINCSCPIPLTLCKDAETCNAGSENDAFPRGWIPAGFRAKR